MNFCVECGCYLDGENFNCPKCGAPVYGTYSKWNSYKNLAGYWCWRLIYGSNSDLLRVNSEPPEYETEILTVIAREKVK